MTELAHTTQHQSTSQAHNSPSTGAALGIMGCCLLLAGALIGLGYLNDVPGPGVVRVSGISSPSVEFPHQATGWQPVELPFRLCPATETPCYDHYQITLPHQPASLAVFFPEFSGSLRVAVNGVQIAQFGALDPPIERLLFKPQLVQIPNHLRHSGNNLLQLTIGADRGNFLRLAPFFIAAPEALASGWRFTHLLSVDLLEVSTGIYLVLGFLAGLTWLLSDQATRNQLFIWFTAIALCAAARNSYFLWTNPHYDFLRDLIYFQSSMGMLAAIAGFTGTLTGLGRPRHYLYLCAATPLLVGLFGWALLRDHYEGTYLANTIVRLLAVITGLFTMIVLARYRANDFKPIKPWVFGMFGGAFLLVLHDVLPSLVQVAMRYQLSNLAPLLLVLAFCFILAHQFSQALRRIRHHNAALADALRAREQDLHTAYQQIRARERTEAVHAERTRILQDVHDGVAGRLAGLVLMARRRGEEHMAQHIQTSLVDLRLIMDSLDERISDNLHQALDTFAQRALPLLQDHGLETHWEIDCPAALKVPPGWILDILRATQEALNNTLRHAQATRVEVRTVVDADALTVVVQDNGQGFDTASMTQSSGRGLQHIRQRIARCGGDVSAQNLHPGTAIALRIPLPAYPQESGGSSAAPNRLASAS